LLYLPADDTAKADTVESLLSTRGVVNVQVLNEFAAVCLRKLKMPLNDVREVLETIRAVCTVEPITMDTHERGLAVYEGCRFSFYDSTLVAAALIVGATTLYSEDLQCAQLIDDQLRVANPF
jgi:predicted nucleic acid-binding protein